MAIERGKLQNLIFDNQALMSHRFMAAILGAILKLPPVKQLMASEQVKSRYFEALLRRALSRKSLLPPPAESASPAMNRTMAPTPETAEEPAPEEVVFVSPFEVALQEANQGDERRRERKKKVRAWDEYEEEEDLIQRTIAHHRKSKGE